MPDTVEVLCVVMPDGSLAYALDASSASQVHNDWAAKLTDEQRFKHATDRTYGGVVHIRMLRDDYDKLDLRHLDREGAHSKDPVLDFNDLRARGLHKDEAP